MIRTFNPAIHTAFLLLFFIVVLSINLCHTEKTLAGDDNCAACHFMALPLESGEIQPAALPPLCLLEILQIFDAIEHKPLSISHPISRGPPRFI
jgi:hypothetical protein